MTKSTEPDQTTGAETPPTTTEGPPPEMPEPDGAPAGIADASTTEGLSVEMAEPAGSEGPPVVVDQADAPGVDRTTDRRLARLHLRTGARALARVELESLAGVGGLDDEALLDLAEVRWRTDDLTGAGEAAAAYLASGREAPLALVIVAEATAALGRPSEARRLASRAVELIDGPLDPVFAGMHRSDVWPVDLLERVDLGGDIGRAAAVAATPTAGSPAGVRSSRPVPALAATGAAIQVDAGRQATPVADSEAMPDPAAELAAARAALAAGDRAGAAIRLAVVLRLAPALAPAVLDIAAAEPGPGFDLVRGDALRLVGRESQARRSFAAAARGSVPAPSDARHDPAPDRESDSQR